MHPLQNGSQVTERPAKKPSSGVQGWFTESGENNIPSYPGQDWFNSVIAEFLNLLSSQGIDFEPNKEDHLKRCFDSFSAPRTTTVSTIQSGAFETGTFLEITDRGFARALVKAGDSYNDIDVIFAGDGKVAEILTKDGKLYLSNFGIDPLIDETEKVQLFLSKGGYLIFDVDVQCSECYPIPNSTLEINAEVKNQKHGYDALILDAIDNVKLFGRGSVAGPGLFPSKTFGGTAGGGEKVFSIAQEGKWPIGRGPQDNGYGSFNGGFIGNGGCGVLIKNGSSNIDVDIETYGHNYAGVCVGDPLLTSQPGEIRNKNITIDGRHHDNYDAGVSYHAVDGLVIKDSIKTYNNGHPDALESDDEINPGYGVTSRLTSDLAESAIDVYIGGRHTFNKRKNVDAHSGQDIRVNAYSEGALVYGAAFGGNSGSRGRVMGQIICKDNAYASGANADGKTQCAVFGEYDSTSLKLIIRGGQAAIPFTLNRVERIDLDLDVISGSGAVKPLKPFSIIATSVNKANVNIRGSIAGAYSGGATASYCSGVIENLDMSKCVYDSSGQSIVMNNCDLTFGTGNSFPYPQFNFGNSGDFYGVETKLIISFDGSSLPPVEYLSGAKYVSQYYSGGNGPEFASVADSYLDSSNLVHSVHTNFRTAKDGNISYIASKDVSNTGKQRVALSAYANNDVLLATSIVNGVSAFATITWGFQI
ncbi:hypothetical protein [Vibrio parahaemolyticus]|uniref:hypothetical protein n=1 Tax=Vibrio parahaemolyticus TaxID=670 RepID=UPI00236034E8|nr:hypothetical protein [Vibrio parahaemolyticus]